MSPASAPESDLKLLSVVIPARDEEGCIASTVEHLHLELRLNRIAHEIVVVDDGSTDRTAAAVTALSGRIPEARLVKNGPPHGFGHAINRGLQAMSGDAVVIMMADESDDCRDVVRYWNALNEGWDAVFGSRFMKGGGVIDYPWLKLRLNRMANLSSACSSGIRINDTTNAFKAYRRTVIDGCQPLLSAHFNLDCRNSIQSHYSRLLLDGLPITWRNRRTGMAKFKIQGDGQPLPVHLSLPVAGETSEPRRLQEGVGMSGSIRSSPKESGPHDAWLCALLVCAAAIATLPWAEVGLDDDWSFAHTALDAARSGHLLYYYWSEPIIGFQAYWAALFVRIFGFSFTLVRLTTLPLAMGSAALLFILARYAGLAPAPHFWQRSA